MAKLSQRTIAKELGISQATVSLVVNDPNTPLLAEATRRRILEYCRKRGYKVGDRRRATDYIGVIMDVEHLAGRSAMHQLLGVIHKTARTFGKNVIFEQPDIEPDTLMRRAPFEGLIVCEAISRTLAKRLASFVPLVFVNYYHELNGFDSVVSDNEGGVQQAVRALHEQEHRELLFIGNDPKSKETGDLRPQQRISGFKQATEELGLRSHIATAPHLVSEPENMRELVREHFIKGTCTGVVAMHDYIGIAFMQRAREEGLSVPEDLSIVGFGDSDQCTYCSPPLTSIHEEFEEMGSLAVDLLVNRLSEEKQRPPRRVTCGTSLVERATLGPAPKR